MFRDIDNPIKIGIVETSGYSFLGVVGLCITWLYYGKDWCHQNPRLTIMMLFLMLGVRLTGFLYMGAKVLDLIQGCSRFLCEVALQVALNIGSVLFDMWVEPHLVSLVKDGESLEAIVLGLLTSLTGMLALTLVHLLWVVESWSKKLDIGIHVSLLVLVLLLMFLVWKLTPSDLYLTSQHAIDSFPFNLSLTSPHTTTHPAGDIKPHLNVAPTHPPVPNEVPFDLTTPYSGPAAPHIDSTIHTTNA